MFRSIYHASTLMAMYAAVLAALNSQVVESATRRLELAVLHSDEYAESVLTIQEPNYPLGIGAQEHAKISSVLDTTRELVQTANSLVKDSRTLNEGRKMMEEANALFQEVKDHIRHKQQKYSTSSPEEREASRELLRAKYSSHDIQQATEDEARGLDVSRRIYETVITFPECLEQLFDNCLAIVNRQLKDLELDTYEIVVHEKRNINQPGYNKVVIVTDMMGEQVMGRLGDSIVSYPFQWDDAVLGPRTLSVDGKWNCYGHTPEECCNTIKQSAPNPNTKGDYIECHIFVPYGGVGNPKRQDRIIVNLSPDGRVQEAPIIT